MNFRRSSFGLSNYRHFLSVDYKVYVEGKTDIRYWQKIFHVFRPELKISIEQRDGSGNLTSIIGDIVSDRVRNVVVCRDSDYGAIVGNLPHHQNIVYTHGYSFENDFINGCAAASIVKLICTSHVDERVIKRAFRIYMHKLSKIGEDLVQADIEYVMARGEGVLKRSNPTHLTEVEDGIIYFSAAEIETEKAKIALHGLARNPGLFDPVKPVFPRFFCGHSAFFLFVQWCKTVSRLIVPRISNVADNILTGFLISHYRDLAHQDALNHMDERLAAVS